MNPGVRVGVYEVIAAIGAGGNSLLPKPDCGSGRSIRLVKEIAGAHRSLPSSGQAE
jgi:hypothetical protein